MSATQFLNVFLTSAAMEIISFDSSSDEEEEINDTSINLLFKNNILTIHHSDGNFDEDEDDDFEILPVLLLFHCNQGEQSGSISDLLGLIMSRNYNMKKCLHRHLGCPLKHMILLSICCMEMSPTIIQNMALELVKIP